MTTMTLKSPLFTDWSEQYVKLTLPDVTPGAALRLTVNGQPAPFQYTGVRRETGAEVMLRFGFGKGEEKTLIFSRQNAGVAEAGLARQELSLEHGARIGLPGRELQIPAPATASVICGPFAGFADSAMTSAIRCETALEVASLHRTNEGPFFTDYELEYRFADDRRYTLDLRCYKLDSYIEVTETFSLRMNAGLTWTLNPEKRFTHIISRDSFEGESQPTVEPLAAERQRDVLCRLQMPVLTEYFIPNNRGWFALCDDRNEAGGMIGILGLYGAKWEEPVANMPEILGKDSTVEWNASLASGKRHWLLYAGPVEKGYRVQGSGVRKSDPSDWTDRTDPSDLKPETRHLKPAPDPRFVFHRLHAEFNALRLDEHLDLAGDDVFDRSCAHAPGVCGTGDYHGAARQRLDQYACLRKALGSPDDWMKQNGSLHMASFRYMLEPSAEHAKILYDHLIARFEKWVRQFQGYRTGENDYMKNVIGFSRFLRGMLLAYEQLRRDDALTETQTRALNAYFAFAARRILDEGRWPHSRTWKHPDHPESSRDFYTYGGEHKPDRLIWTNCLPNFQSDPLCALAHLSAVFKDHPDAAFWRRFGLDEIDRQLDAYCGRSGAWEESINYALYTFSYFVITFKAVKERWGLDYFNDERVRRFVSWLCRFLGPVDKRFGVYTMPGVGNAVLPQTGGHYMLCYANELAADDPLRADCLAIWQRVENDSTLGEHYPVVLAAMAPVGPAINAQGTGTASRALLPLRVLSSEIMDEVGVAMRDRHTQPDESYLFQKIGFAKDHYEADETSFNWYAKGTPLCMDYGTYTGDIGVAAAHNLVEIPDEDNLRRGYLADHLLTPAVDYTRCEVPVTLKLLWGKVRTFAEVENKDGKIDRTKTPYFYIGDKNPVGPKVWKVRQLLFVKPDYTVLFDRVYGRVHHRCNVHFTGTEIRREGATITAAGRFDLDLLAFVQHPAEFGMETGEIIPKVHSGCGGEDARAKHAQHYFRLYNRTDGIYRTLLFARERGRDVQVTAVGEHGIKIVTPEYTDYVFLHNDFIEVQTAEVAFSGRAGWIRQWRDGRIQAVVPDGEVVAAFGLRLDGRGPWSYGIGTDASVTLHGPTPRAVSAME